LVNERYNVTSAGLAQPLKNAVLLGIKIENLKSIEHNLKEIKAADPSIKDIMILKTEAGILSKVFSTSSEVFSKRDLNILSSSLRSSKNNYWRGSLSNDIGYSGTTIRDVVNQEKASIVILYDLKTLKQKEEEEIYNLYQRLIISILFIIVVNFISGYKHTKEISRIMEATEQSLEAVIDNPEKKIDLCIISNSEIRTEMRALVEQMSYAGKTLVRVNDLISMANKIPRSEYESVPHPTEAEQ
jgi:hypothetical protein